MAEQVFQSRGLHGRVVHQLGIRIVSGAIAPGETLATEDVLGAELGVSRSVLREAIKVLAGKGLVEVRPKTGTRVRARRNWHLLDPQVVRWQFEQLSAADDLVELAEVRAAVEPAAARLAAGRRTDAELADIEAHCKRMESATLEPLAFRAAELDFHSAVIDAAHNTMLSHMALVIRIALSAAPRNGAAGVQGTQRHRTVLDAIARNDAVAADNGMQGLLEQSKPPVAKEH